MKNTDVALRDAVILYFPTSRGKYLGVDCIVRLQRDPIAIGNYFSCDIGANNVEWREEKDIIKLKLKLLMEIWHICTFDGVSSSDMHQALLVIPEYREMLASDVYTTSTTEGKST